jgi:hypothetical protein
MTPPPPPDRRAIGVIGAYVEGWRRVLRAPAVWVGLLVVGIVSMFAPVVVVGVGVEAYRIAPIDVAGEASRAAKHLIYALPGLIDPSTDIVGAFEHAPITSATAASLTSHIVFWLFLWGGVLDRLARARPVGSAAFFAACGVYLWRFLRLAVPLALLYWGVDFWLRPHPVAEFAALVLLLIIADFAKVRAVVEDRRSMAGALLASSRFVRRHPVAVVALCVLNLGASSLVAELAQLRFTLETGLNLPAWVHTFQNLLGMMLGLWTRLAFAASEIAYFQGQLAHAEYTAAPLPIWPDSPAAEAIENLTRVGPKPS